MHFVNLLIFTLNDFQNESHFRFHSLQYIFGSGCLQRQIVLIKAKSIIYIIYLIFVSYKTDILLTGLLVDTKNVKIYCKEWNLKCDSF
jgi:hypothetical protein